MDLKSVLPHPRTALSKEQKVAFVLLMFLGIGGALLGFLSFGANIRRPFDLQIAKYTGTKVLTSVEKEEQAVKDQKAKDTDGDGLSDYDETAVFKTSPYLADTDSDGFDDKTEAFSGNDPNCPVGRVCSGIVASVDGTTAISANPADVVGPFKGSISGDLSQFNVQSTDDLKVFFQNMSPADIRTALINAGVPKEQLDGVDDETLRTLFLQSLEQVNQADTTATGTSATATPPEPAP